ncbi:MAG: hypothetical protein A3D31_17640 [Candidatus Fluviicola riflensis]|nr:MAG: hypothetical protein CHH17_02580 [Candidatus Fluviicola riflensis]OGS76807.1 MAG: hypothetical protein A3D31_17640 [Candidatus Fluviicola riflensis]OGS82838.1 MAG: hypothetical protein A2724_13720 [Fluviicola sp. RIFCSPHIGHO2_01_FULL_43_53]OGS88537.1 MAG: hypothetical protein A3E30_07145 [Fluviicola sp. RIFCSPHIGHO2_12_FULL_43_24]
MKALNSVAILLLTFLFSNLIFATDRVVQQGGPVGTYASISAAITASVDGDVIIINNRTDGLPWLEGLSINKSLTFVSAVDNVQWWMEGTVNVTMAEGRVVTIIGCRNSAASGAFTKTGTTPVNRTVVNVLYSDITSDITMGNGINFYLGSSKARDVIYTFGKLYGNDLRSLSLNSDAVTTEDVNQVIGNRIGASNAATSHAFYHNSTTQYLFCSNNYIRSATGIGFYIGALKSGATTNRIVNCALVCAFSSSVGNNFAGLYLSHTSGALSVENCTIGGNWNGSSNGSHSIYASGTAQAITTFTYCMYYNYYATGYNPSSSLNNFASTNASYSNYNADGVVTAGSSHIDAGNPSNASLDLDLSRNDIGVMGGSYSMANFLPFMSNVESSRVNFMNTPRIVNQGGTVSVQVIGYDK